MIEFFIVLVTVIIAFCTTFFIIPYWIKKARTAGLVGKDMNKYDKPEIPEAGGVAVIMGVIFALLFYISVKTFYLGTEANLIETFAILVTLILAGFVGFIDDILGWKVGIRQRHKVLLTIPIGIPLMVINAGESLMFLPFIGPVNFGIIYPLIIIPIGVIGAVNGCNMLAGYNGLEAGMGVVIIGALGVVSWLNGFAWLALFAFSAVSALLAFLVFNWYPAKIFPGDSLTYSVGAIIASIAILGGMEKIAVILFIPYILDAVINFVRIKMEPPGFNLPEAFATRVNKDKSLEYKAKISGFEPAYYVVARKLKKKVYERQVTSFLILIEFILVLIVFLFFI